MPIVRDDAEVLSRVATRTGTEVSGGFTNQMSKPPLHKITTHCHTREQRSMDDCACSCLSLQRYDA